MLNATTLGSVARNSFGDSDTESELRRLEIYDSEIRGPIGDFLESAREVRIENSQIPKSLTKGENAQILPIPDCSAEERRQAGCGTASVGAAISKRCVGISDDCIAYKVEAVFSKNGSTRFHKIKNVAKLFFAFIWLINTFFKFNL